MRGAVDSIMLKILNENTVKSGSKKLIAEHGLSIYVEAKSGNEVFRMLADVGQSGEVIFKNASVMGVDLKSVDTVFISHGHYDHAGGLLNVVEKLGKVKVYVHPLAIRRRFKVIKGELIEVTPEYAEEDLRRCGAEVVHIKEPYEVFPGIMFSGEVKRYLPLEVKENYFVKENGELKPDNFSDDQSIFINVKNKN